MHTFFRVEHKEYEKINKQYQTKEVEQVGLPIWVLKRKCSFQIKLEQWMSVAWSKYKDPQRLSKQLPSQIWADTSPPLHMITSTQGITHGLIDMSIKLVK